MVAGMAPNGAISCSKCKSYAGFVAFYGKAKASIIYVDSGIDSDNSVIYRPVAVKGVWRQGDIPTAVNCFKCRANIPVLQLTLNSYVRSNS